MNGLSTTPGMLLLLTRQKQATQAPKVSDRSWTTTDEFEERQSDFST